jgi:hypothetical protein
MHSLFSRSRSYFTTDGQSVSQSVSQYVLVSSPLWDLWPDITSCRKVAVRKLRSCFCEAPSLTRGRVCSLQCNHSVVRSHRTRNQTLLSHLRLHQRGGPGSRICIPRNRVALGTGFPLPHLLRLAGLRWRYSNPPPTWRARSPYVYPSGTGWSSPVQSSQSEVMTNLDLLSSRILCLYSNRFPLLLIRFTSLFLLTCRHNFRVTTDGVWIGNRIYWTLCYSSWLQFLVQSYRH